MKLDVNEGNGAAQLKPGERPIRYPLVKKGPSVEHAVAEILPLNTAILTLEVIGKTPLIVHAWSVKAQRMILEKQMQDPKLRTTRKAREAKDPFEDFVGSLHVMPGAKLPKGRLKPWESWAFKKNTFGIPASTFGHGARFVMNQVGMDKANRSSIQVIGDLLPLTFSRLVMREDMVKVGWPPVADIRHRGMFEDWSTEIVVEYDRDFSSPLQIVNLFNRAGTYSGALEWRPSSPKKPGSFGKYFVRGEKALKAAQA